MYISPRKPRIMEQAITGNIHSSTKPAAQSKLWLASIAIMVFGALIYAPALSGPAIWDDHDLLNAVGTGFPGSVLDCFRRPFLFYYYRPLTSLSFFLERRLTDNPFLFHQTNLILRVLAIGAF